MQLFPTKNKRTEDRQAMKSKFLSGRREIIALFNKIIIFKCFSTLLLLGSFMQNNDLCTKKGDSKLVSRRD